MKNRVVRTLVSLDKLAGIEALRQCPSVKERYDKLTELVPEAVSWNEIATKQLVFYLHHKYWLNFAVCPFYSLDDEKQYCSYPFHSVADQEQNYFHENVKKESLCALPQPFCVFRDRNGRIREPEFLSFKIQELEEQFQQAFSGIH